MKTVYWEYYHPNKKEFEKMKKEALFVFDACSLLDLYTLPKSKTDKILSALDKLSKYSRIWMPHQFGIEYHQNRKSKIKEQINYYDNALIDIDNFINKPIFSDFKNHYSLNEKKIKKLLSDFFKGIKKDIKKKKNNHPKWSKNDSIFKKLDQIFKDNVGEKYPDNILVEKYKEIEQRMELKKHPGLLDVKSLSKDRSKVNGDALAWLQIIDYANQIKKPVILITEETKPDFWEDKKISSETFPKRTLIREVYDKTKQLFFILNMDEFYKFVTDKKYLPIYPEVGVEEKSLQDINSGVIGAENISQLTN